MSVNSTTFDSVLDLCQHQHRRIVLGVLTEEQRPLTINDLTKAILKYNHHMPATEVSEDVLTDIHIWLHHQQLPKLASEGFINYDSGRQLVEPTEQVEKVQPALATILDTDPSVDTPVEL